jgi:GTP-binding protein EngB required for normal cell division
LSAHSNIAASSRLDDSSTGTTSLPAVVWSEIGRCIDRLEALGVLSVATAAELRQKALEQRFDLVVAGQFKRGKTSLINALIGAELLPVAVVPLTSVITVLSYGPKVTATIVYESGERHPIPVDALAAYVTERGNPNNEKRVREAHVTCPSRWLVGGIRLIDTPGVGSVYESNTDVTQRFLPQSDAVLFVLSVDQPLSAAECEFLASIRPYAQRIFFLLNKADLLNEEELRESMDFTRGALRSVLGVEPALFAVSARLGLQSGASGSIPARSGMDRFCDALDAFLLNEKGRVLALAVARRLARAIDEARFVAELELHSLTEPLGVLARKADHFRAKQEEMRKAREDLDVLLGQDASRSLLVPLERSLAQCKDVLRRDVLQALEACYAKSSGRRSREIHQLLDDEAIRTIREGFDRWQREQSESIDHAFAAFCARHVERVDRIVDKLYRFAGDLFDVAAPARTGATFHEIESHFYYQFWSEPPALRTLSFALLHALPRFVGARLILDCVRARALELIDMQSGRLRYDFSRRIDAGITQFRAAMSSRTDAAVAAIEKGIDKALDLRRAGEADAKSRGDMVNAQLRALHEAEHDLAAAIARSGIEDAAVSPPATTAASCHAVG